MKKKTLFSKRSSDLSWPPDSILCKCCFEFHSTKEACPKNFLATRIFECPTDNDLCLWDFSIVEGTYIKYDHNLGERRGWQIEVTISISNSDVFLLSERGKKGQKNAVMLSKCMAQEMKRDCKLFCPIWKTTGSGAIWAACKVVKYGMNVRSILFQY